MCDVRTTGHGEDFPASTDNVHRWTREIAAAEGDYSEA